MALEIRKKYNISMKLPEKISPCPIVEAIVEIRFQPSLPLDAVFGMVYSAVKDDFSTTEKLPILQLPEAVRDQDPNLRYKPHYRLKGEKFLMNVGSRVLSVINTGDYIGWDKFFEKIKSVLVKIEPLKIMDKIVRIGIRYVNFFEDLDIYDKINLKINFHDQPFAAKQKTFKALMDKSPFISNLQLVNNNQVNVKGQIETGSVLDSDNYIENLNGIPYSDLEKVINAGHLVEKEIFFSLLTDEYINTLNPVYKD